MIDFAILEDRMREHLNEVARRRMAVLDPVKLVIDGYPEGKEERMEVPDHPQKPDWGRRAGSLSRELWIERGGHEVCPRASSALPGNEVRLRYGYVVKCVGMKDGRSLHPLPRLALGIPRRRGSTSEREHPLGERKTCARGQGAPLRPPVPGARARARTAIPGRHQSRLAPHRRSAGRAELGEPGLPPALPVRARLLHRRLRPAVVQPDRTLRDSWSKS